MNRRFLRASLCLLLCGAGCATSRHAAPPTVGQENVVAIAEELRAERILAVLQSFRVPAIEPCVNEIHPAAFKPVGTLQQETKFRDYTVRIYRDMETGDGCFEILRAGRRIYAQKGIWFEVGGTFGESNEETELPMGLSVTGDAPNLVVREYTSGAHCCFWYHIFEIGNSFRPIAAIPTMHSPACFRDLDHDGVMEIELADWSYAYQFTCFAASPAVRVVLRYRDGSYQVAPDLMWKPPPSDADLVKKARELRALYEKERANPGKWGAPADLWAEMLELTYSGHEDLAYQLFHWAWPRGTDGKAEALARFKELLNRSPFYREMSSAR